MIVTGIQHNVADLTADELSGLHVERVELDLQDLRRRVQRVVGDHGTEIGIRLAPGATLRDGDILQRDQQGIVVVAVRTADVLLIAPRSIEEMGRVAHTLGNRHLPAQFLPAGEAVDEVPGHQGLMVIQYDHTAEHHLQHAGVPHVRAQRAMETPFTHAEHTH